MDTVPGYAGPPSPVAVLKAASYSTGLGELLVRGIEACGLDVRGKSVLLKPNYVEFARGKAINTDTEVVCAAVEAFHRLGARAVAIGEGPAHRRDTLGLMEAAGARDGIPGFDRRFTDLNRDDLTAVPGFAPRGRIYLPNAVLSADLVVSMPKLKTHHWAGVTLSMKNLFGIVPGAVYGWPKNMLHQYGIDRSVLELNRIVRNTFAIVDGIVGMEGDGPIHGKPKPVGVLVLGRDLRAVDATCCRLMGVDPLKISYLRMAAPLGHLEAAHIEQRGEDPAPLATAFEMAPTWIG